MSLHPVLLEKLNTALGGPSPEPGTLREARLPAVPGKIHAVIGMRRAGKTTYLRQLEGERRHALGPGRAVYISFDDDRLSDLPLAQLDFLLEELYRRHPPWRGRQLVHLYFDEIQLVEGWERFVRRVLDTEKVDLVVSGSSARLLSREVHTSLRGRGMATVIRPFSFREFLRHRNEEPASQPGIFMAPERSSVERRFRQYLVQGGFPEAQGLDDGLRVELLQGYVDALLLRDIVERFGVTQVAALRWLTRQALRNPAALLSVHRLHRDLVAQGLGVAKDALHGLLDHLCDAFLIGQAPLATDSERRRNSNPRKLYPADLALIGAFDRSGRANTGHALECAVFNELERRGAEIGYVKTEQGHEVDFLARFPGGKAELIQVCADLDDPDTRLRELRGLEEARLEHPRAKRRLLLLDGAQATAQVPGVIVQSAWQWMLEGP